MPRMSADTTPEQLARHAAIIRAMTSQQRAQALQAIDRGVRRLVIARIMRRHPNASEREIVIRHVAQIHGVAVARHLYGVLPSDLDK
jgi:hypothetical protein